MFELNIGPMPNELVDTEYDELSERSKGYDFTILSSLCFQIPIVISYSGTDISVAVRDALLQRIRGFVFATHFKPVKAGVSGNVKWTSCSPDDPEVI